MNAVNMVYVTCLACATTVSIYRKQDRTSAAATALLVRLYPHPRSLLRQLHLYKVQLRTTAIQQEVMMLPVLTNTVLTLLAMIILVDTIIIMAITAKVTATTVDTMVEVENTMVDIMGITMAGNTITTVVTKARKAVDRTVAGTVGTMVVGIMTTTMGMTGLMVTTTLIMTGIITGLIAMRGNTVMKEVTIIPVIVATITAIMTIATTTMDLRTLAMMTAMMGLTVIQMMITMNQSHKATETMTIISRMMTATTNPHMM